MRPYSSSFFSSRCVSPMPAVISRLGRLVTPDSGPVRTFSTACTDPKRHCVGAPSALNPGERLSIAGQEPCHLPCQSIIVSRVQEPQSESAMPPGKRNRAESVQRSAFSRHAAPEGHAGGATLWHRSFGLPHLAEAYGRHLQRPLHDLTALCLAGLPPLTCRRPFKGL